MYDQSQVDRLKQMGVRDPEAVLRALSQTASAVSSFPEEQGASFVPVGQPQPSIQAAPVPDFMQPATDIMSQPPPERAQGQSWPEEMPAKPGLQEQAQPGAQQAAFDMPGSGPGNFAQPQQNALGNTGRLGVDIPKPPGVSPGDKGPLENPSVIDQQQAIQDLGNLQAKNAAAQEGKLLGAADAMEKQRIAAQTAMQQTQSQLHAASLHAASNPMNEWSQGKHLMATIAVFLGGFGKGPNYAMESINHQIDREVKLRQGAVDNLTTQFGNQKAAYLALHAGLLDQVKSQIDAMAVSALGKEKQQQAQVLSAALGVESDKYRNLINENNFQNEIAAANVGVHQQQAQLKAQEDFVPGLGQMRTQDAKEAAAFMRNKAGADAAIKELIALRAKYPGGKVPVGADSARATQLSKSLMLAAKQGLNLGVLSDSDVKLLESMAGGDALSLTSLDSAVLARLMGQRKSWQKQEEVWRSQAIRPDRQTMNQQDALPMQPVRRANNG